MYLFFIRPIPRCALSRWRIFLLRLFGAKIHKTAKVYSGAKIYYPANLIMEEYSSLGPGVDCYNVDTITIGAYSTISQNATLCTASHDISDLSRPLITKPINIGKYSWIGAEAFISMGLNIEDYAIVGARSMVTKDVKANSVVGGNPAKFIKNRIILKN